MSKSKESFGLGTIFLFIGKFLLLCLLPQIFAVFLIYGLLYLIINLITLAVNCGVKGKVSAKSTFSDHMHELFVSLLNLLKDYFFLIFK